MTDTLPSAPSHFEGEGAKTSPLTHSCSSGYQCAHKDPPEHLRRLCPPRQRGRELAASPGWKSTPVPFLVKGSKASPGFQLCLRCTVQLFCRRTFFCLHKFLQQTDMTQGLEKGCLHAFVKINAKLQKSPLSKDVGILDVSLKQTVMHSEQCSEQCSESC